MGQANSRTRPRRLSDKQWACGCALGCLALPASLVLWYLYICYRPPQEIWRPSYSVTADGKGALLNGRNGVGLWLFDPETGQTREVDHRMPWTYAPAVSANGSFWVATRPVGEWARYELWLIPRDGRAARQLTFPDGGQCDASPTISRDGAWVLFKRAHRMSQYSMGGWNWYDWDVYRIRPDGRDLQRLTHDNNYQIEPRVRPDGSGFVALDYDGNETLRSYALDGGWRSIPARIGNGGEPALSPDGKHLAFSSDDASPYRYEVHVAGLDGSQQQQLTRLGRRVMHLQFGPDSRWVYFFDDDDPPGLYRVNVADRQCELVVPRDVLQDPAAFAAPHR